MALLRRLWKLIMAGTTQLASTLRFMNQLEHENVDHHVQQLAREACLPVAGTNSEYWNWILEPLWLVLCSMCRMQFDYFFLLFS